MKFFKLPLIVCLTLIIAADVLAQTKNRRNRRPQPTAATPQAAPTPDSTPAKPILPRQRVRLATVNGQLITTADIDSNSAEIVETLEQRLSEERQRVLTMEINTALLALEARKRNISSQQLYDMEVTHRIGEPSEAEINKIVSENQSQLAGEDPAKVRAQVIGFLKAEREAKLSEALVTRLRNSTPVVMRSDPNSPNLAPSTVIATVGPTQITAAALAERLKPIVFQLRLDSYEVAKGALDRTVTDMLLIAEANKRNVPPEEIVRTEVTNKVKAPTEAEVAKFYAENRTRINGEFESVRHQIANYLQEQERRRLEKLMADRLREGADVKLLIAEPEPPKQVVSVDDDPARGPATAPVTIIEFTDFQCPSCAAMQPILEEAVKTYGAKIRFVVRDFPLSGHANAFKAAEAANAANAQGKFWEYTALLFKHQNALDVPSLKQYASEVGLNRARFDSELDRGIYRAEVRNDMNDGEIYGVGSTPTIFINGVMLKELSNEGLREAIDRALAATSATPRP